MDAEWAEWYDCYFGAYDEDSRFFLEEARKAKGRVLEVGCGTGRLTLPLLRAGVRVVGFDPVSEMLDRLRAKAAALKLTAAVSRQDMISFRSRDRFALILAPFRVFNHCLTPSEQRAALENFRRHLAPNGRLILATFVPDPELIATATSAIQYMATVMHPQTGHAVVCSQFNAELDVVNQIRTDVWIHEELDAAQRVLRKAYLPVRIRWVYPSEMALLLELAGFNEFQVFGGFDRQPLEESSREQVWIARSVARRTRARALARA